MINVGDRVMVFDSRLFKDDISTPLSITMKPATVVNVWTTYEYFDTVDVRFDHRPEEVSRGHFATFMEKLNG